MYLHSNSRHSDIQVRKIYAGPGGRTCCPIKQPRGRIYSVFGMDHIIIFEGSHDVANAVLHAWQCVCSSVQTNSPVPPISTFHCCQVSTDWIWERKALPKPSPCSCCRKERVTTVSNPSQLPSNIWQQTNYRVDSHGMYVENVKYACAWESACAWNDDRICDVFCCRFIVHQGVCWGCQWLLVFCWLLSCMHIVVKILFYTH